MWYVYVVIVPRRGLAKLLQYIDVVLQDRLNSYDPTQKPGILGIDSVENGMFFEKGSACVILGSGAVLS